jgi:putative heme-binding domain-containing protein
VARALSRVPAAAFNRSNSPALAALERLRDDAVATLVASAEMVMEREDASLEEKVAAIDDLGLDSFERQSEKLEELLSPQRPAAIHAAVFSTCARYESSQVAEMVLSRWEELAPADRSAATELMLRRKVWAAALLKFLSKENTSLATFDPGHMARLENYPSADVSGLARKLRGRSVAADRQQVFQDYRAAASIAGDFARGKLVFQNNCAACHVLSSAGNAVGPNLAAMANRGAESLLFNVLVPNGEVDPRYLEYVVLTIDGLVVTGIIAGETSTAVTLRGPDNKTTSLLRVEIDEMRNTGQSLMPEGFERLIDKQAMADLLAYIQRAAAAEGASP